MRARRRKVAMRLVRIVESNDDRMDRLVDAVLKVYGDELTDDEVVRLVSNLRRQANDIVNSREKVDVLINPDEDKVIHDWEDQVTTDKSPVTDDTEIVPAKRVSNPDSSEDDAEVSGDGTKSSDGDDSDEDLENDPDYDDGEESDGESEESGGDDSEDGDSGEGSDGKPGGKPDGKSGKVTRRPSKRRVGRKAGGEGSGDSGKDSDPDGKNEGLRLVRRSR